MGSFDWDKYEDAPSPSEGTEKDFDWDKYPDAPEYLVGSEEKPRDTSVYKTDSDRISHSFGDMEGKKEYMESRGFNDVHVNKDGKLVGSKGPGENQFYTDQEGFFHPINWMENRMGKSLPLAGMLGGGAAGSRGGLPGSMLGGGAGSTAGELVRQAIGKKLGTYKGDEYDQALEAAGEGADGILGETLAGVGGPFLNPLIRRGANKALELGKDVVSTLSGFATAVPKKAVKKLIESPTKVMDAYSDPKFTLDTGRAARDELLARDALEDKTISNARTDFRNKFGSNQVKTNPIVDDLQAFIDKHQPTSEGYGALSDEEQKILSDIRQNAFSTIRSTAPAPAPGTNQMNLPLASSQKNALDLHKFADHLDNLIKNFDQSKLPGSGDTKFQAYVRSLYGKTKDALHEIDPDGLTKADARFSDYARKAGTLRRLENPETMESFVDNYYGRNKNYQREVGNELIPNSMDDIEALGAAKAYSTQGPSGSAKGRRTAFGNMAGGLLSLQGVVDHNIPAIIAGTSVKAATSPGLNMAIIGNASKLLDKMYGTNWFQSFAEDPKLIQTITNVELRKNVQKLMDSYQVQEKIRSKMEGN